MKSLKGYINIRKKPSTVKAENDTILNIVKDGITRFGKEVDLNYIDTSRCTSFANLFYNCYIEDDVEDIKPDVSKWDVSNVSDFSFCFCLTSFNGDLSDWDMSSAENLNSMFNESNKFEGIGLENWAKSLSNVINTKYMFRATQITGKQLESWELPNVKHVENMFLECRHLDCDLSNWNFFNMNKYDQYKHMLSGCMNMRKKPEFWPKVKHQSRLFDTNEI